MNDIIVSYSVKLILLSFGEYFYFKLSYMFGVNENIASVDTASNKSKDRIRTKILFTVKSQYYHIKLHQTKLSNIC